MKQLFLGLCLLIYVTGFGQNYNQVFVKNANVGLARVSGANTARDGSGSNIGTLFTAGANGSYVYRITMTESDATASSTSVAQIGRVWVFDATNNAATLSSAVIAGTAGQFTCTAPTGKLSIGDQVTISGTLGGTGTITGYSNPTTYFITTTTGTTSFTLSTTAGGTAVVTTAGTPTGLTYTITPVSKLYTELLMPSTAGTTTAKGGTTPLIIPAGLFLPTGYQLKVACTLGSATTGQVDFVAEGGDL